ncbi:transposase [Oceanobacillus sp. CAU 1775]
MPRTKSRSDIYHVIYRGANQQEIFHDSDDNMRFLETLHRFKNLSKMKVLAWCLMNNHVHLLLQEGSEEISSTLKRISVSYAHYYNTKYRTTGHLFQDRYRSENVESRRYLFTVVRYIHQNPVKAGITKRVDQWEWSSCNGYYGEACYPSGLLDYHIILDLLSNNLKDARARFKEFNERVNNDSCLENTYHLRLTDDEARAIFKEILGPITIPQIKTLPKSERDTYLRKLKTIKGISQRQTARILGVSTSLVHRA